LNDKKGTEKFVAYGLTDDYFQGEEVDLYDSIRAHLDKYGVLPKPATVQVQIPGDLETPEFYLDHVRTRFRYRQLVSVVKESNVLLHNKDTDAAFDLMRNMVLNLTVQGSANQLVDFTTDAARILDDEYQLLTKGNTNPGILTGYPSVDKMSMGLRGGDVLAIVGRPQQGKTYQLLRMAHHAWHTQKKRVLVVSMEMKPLPLIQRITAMHEHMSITLLRKAEIPKSRHKKLMASLQALENDHDKLYIVDGNLAATIQDILLLCHQLQPDVLYIDGGYLVQNAADKRMARWERIGTVLEIAKQQISTGLGIPTIASYQFNKEGAKSKDLENIGGTDIIGQTASIVLALYEKDADQDSYDARKKVDIIKGRNGEQGEFWIRWLFDTPPFMEFSEIPEGVDTNKQMEVYV
jgi:replicative DNA helicase